MFRAYLDKNIKASKDIVSSLKTVSLQTVNESSLPVFVKSFINAEVSEIKSKNEADKLIVNAVKLKLNFTIRPKWTILNYLFANCDSNPTAQIRNKVGIFEYYGFYTDLISKYIEESTDLILSRKTVNSLIDETNEYLYSKLVNNISAIKTRNFFIQLFKLKYGEDAEISLDSEIPYLWIKLFLEDKEFPDTESSNSGKPSGSFLTFLSKFNVHDELKDNSGVALKTIIKVFSEKYSSRDKPPGAVTEAGKAVADAGMEESGAENAGAEQTGAGAGRTGLVQTEAGAEDGRTEKKDDNYKDNTVKQKRIVIKEEDNNDTEREGKPKRIVLVEEGSSTKENKSISRHIPDSDEEKKEMPVEVIEEPENTEHKHLRRILNESELEKISKKVFRSSRFVMLNTLDKLEDYGNWADASAYLKDLFIKNKIDIYDKDVLNFINALHNYFKLL